MRPILGRATAVATAAVTLIGGGVAVAAAHAPTRARTTAAAPACTADQLVATLRPLTGGGTAGQTYELLAFSNVSAHACTLRGYPGVSAVDRTGAQIGRAATKATGVVPRGATPRTVTLSPATATTYGTALASIRFAITENFPARACRARIASGLKVYAPNTTTPLSIPEPFSMCAGTSEKVLQVGPVGPDRTS